MCVVDGGRAQAQYHSDFMAGRLNRSHETSEVVTPFGIAARIFFGIHLRGE